MTGLNFPKAASRDAGRGVPRYRSDAGWSPSTTEEEVKRILLGPDALRCHGCPDYFVTDGSEERARPIHLCARCRLELEEEADLNGLPLTVADDDLTGALATIAKCEARMVTTKRPRRVRRLNDQIEDLRRELREKAARSPIKRRAAA